MPARSVISALQFRMVDRGLGEKEIPHGLWTCPGACQFMLIAALAALALTVFLAWIV